MYKQIILNKDFEGYKYIILGMTSELFCKYYDKLKNKEDIAVDDIKIEYSSVVGFGECPENIRDMKNLNVNVIPKRMIRDLDGKPTSSYYCYAMKDFEYDKTLIRHQDVESSWKCIKELLINKEFIIIFKVKPYGKKE